MNDRVKEVKVRVTPNASREYLEEAPFDTIRVAVRDANEGNRANDRVRELIAEHFAVPVKNVMIIKGTQSPSKIIRIYL